MADEAAATFFEVEWQAYSSRGQVDGFYTNNLGIHELGFAN